MASGAIDSEIKDSLLWGIVGGMAFLVLVQGYHLLGGAFVGIPAMAGVALLVAAVTAVSAHFIRPWLA